MTDRNEGMPWCEMHGPYNGDDCPRCFAGKPVADSNAGLAAKTTEPSALKSDLARHVQIASDLATELAECRIAANWMRDNWGRTNPYRKNSDNWKNWESAEIEQFCLIDAAIKEHNHE